MVAEVTLKGVTYVLEVTPYGKYADDIQLDVHSVLDEQDNEIEDEGLIDSLIDKVYDAYSDTIYEEWYESKVGEAQSWFDSLEDR